MKCKITFSIDCNAEKSIVVEADDDLSPDDAQEFVDAWVRDNVAGIVESIKKIKE